MAKRIVAPHNYEWVFAYGTLQDPLVLHLLLGRVDYYHTAEWPARLNGYELCRAVMAHSGAACAFPGVWANPDAVTYGKLLRVPQRAMRALDSYEGAMYTCDRLEVEVLGAPSPCNLPWVYLPSNLLAKGPSDWNLGDWQMDTRKIP